MRGDVKLEVLHDRRSRAQIDRAFRRAVREIDGAGRFFLQLRGPIVANGRAVRGKLELAGRLDVRAARHVRGGRAARRPGFAGRRNFKLFVSDDLPIEQDAEFPLVRRKDRARAGSQSSLSGRNFAALRSALRHEKIATRMIQSAIPAAQAQNDKRPSHGETHVFDSFLSLKLIRSKLRADSPSAGTRAERPKIPSARICSTTRMGSPPLSTR